MYGDSTCFLPPPEPDFPPPESRWLAIDLTALRAESTTPCAVLGPVQTHNDQINNERKHVAHKHRLYKFIPL